MQCRFTKLFCLCTHLLRDTLSSEKQISFYQTQIFKYTHTKRKKENKGVCTHLLRDTRSSPKQTSFYQTHNVCWLCLIWKIVRTYSETLVVLQSRPRFTNPSNQTKTLCLLWIAKGKYKKQKKNIHSTHVSHTTHTTKQKK